MSAIAAAPVWSPLFGKLPRRLQKSLDGLWYDARFPGARLAGRADAMQSRHFLKFLTFLSLVLLALFVGWVDWFTGYRVNVVAFYSAPIVLAVWWLGNKSGFLMAFLCALICLFVRRLSLGAPPLPHLVEAWNTLMRFTTFSFFCLGAAAFRFKVETLRTQVKMLTGILPICNCCKKIKDGQGYWNDLEAYLHEHSSVDVTHKLCPDCSRNLQAGKLVEPAGLGPAPVPRPSAG